MTTDADQQKANRGRVGGRLYDFGVAAFLGLVLLLAVEECDDEDTTTDPPTTPTTPTTLETTPTTSPPPPTTAPEPSPSIPPADTEEAPTVSLTPPQPCTHCSDVQQGMEEGWYPEDLDPLAATLTTDLQQILTDFEKDHPDFELDAALDALGDTVRVNRFTMAEAIANALNIPHDENNPLEAVKQLADLEIVYGYQDIPNPATEENFGGTNVMTNDQMASFLNRIKQHYSSAASNNTDSPTLTPSTTTHTTTHTTTPTATAPTVDPCESALNDLAATVHIVAGASSAPRPENSVGQTQTVVASRLSSLWLVVTSGPRRGTAVSYDQALDACDPHSRVQWIWAFSPNWVEVDATCRTRSSCSYRVTESAAVDQTFQVWATPWAVAQTQAFYGATSSPSQVVTRAAQAP